MSADNTHPFFVNQRPYLPVASSSKNTIHSSSSTSSFIYSYPESSPTHTRTTSTTSVNTLATFTSTSSRSTSTSSTDRELPIDRDCLRWMQNESDSEHIFGSVSSRGKSISMEERLVRRQAAEEAAEAERVEEKLNTKTSKADKRKGRVGKWF